MPKEIAHILLADDVRATLPDDLRSLLLRHQTAYYFGSTAVDLFYYDFQLPWEQGDRGDRWGAIIHGKDGEATNKHVLWMLARVRDAGLTTARAERRFAFAAGYLTHVALDITFHPVVYSVSGNYFHTDPLERRRSEARHRTFESCLDLYLLETRSLALGKFPYRCGVPLDKEMRADLLEFYCDSLTRSFDPKTPLYHIARRAYAKSRFLLRLFPSRIAFRFFQTLETTTGSDMSYLLNLFYAESRAPGRIPFTSLRTVPHPVTGKPYPAQIDQLWQTAREKSVTMLTQSWNYVRRGIGVDKLKRTVRPYSLNNGMEQMPTERMRHAKVLPRLESWNA